MPDDPKEIRSKAVDDFLKAVYLLQQQIDPVPTNLLAQTLRISAPSVTDMVKRMAGIDDDKEKKHRREDETAHKGPPLVEYEPYHGVRLNEEGKKIALEVIRHHRLLELYLVEKLGYSWDEVHDEAEQLEHYVSEKLEARIAAALGNPHVDPHGDPIPALDGTITAQNLSVLAELPIHEPAVVSRIVDQHPEVLRYLSEIDLTPGIPVQVIERAPLNDTVTIQIAGEATYTISTLVARSVLVGPPTA
ncbi:MAG TPA: metal-dependent transcriptional regulator [Aggregatilineales bacterium]|nr:metal-dependent transcriptional regulator [Aggregatilineales bacterium]